MGSPSTRTAAENSPNVKNFLCGGLAGVAAKTAVAPLDRVKIHFQVQSPSFEPYRGKLRGVFQAVLMLYHQHGIRGLYRGHSMTILRIFPYSATNYVCYEQSKKLLYSNLPPERVSWWRRIAAGSLAGASAVIVTYPLDLIRTRLAFDLSSNQRHTQNHNTVSPRNSLHLIKQTLRKIRLENNASATRNISGFYQGLTPTLMGIIPYAGTSFFSFESLKIFYRKWKSVDGEHVDYSMSIPVTTKLVLGTTAGILAQTVSYPLDIVRRHMQVFNVAPHLQGLERTSMISLIKSIAKAHHGLRGFYAGLSINYIKVAPATGISFVVYEFLREHLFSMHN